MSDNKMEMLSNKDLLELVQAKRRVLLNEFNSIDGPQDPVKLTYLTGSLMRNLVDLFEIQEVILKRLADKHDKTVIRK